MAAHHIGTGGAKDFGGGLQHLGQHAGLQGGRQAGQGDLRQRDLRCRRHGPDITQRMGGGDPGHQARVVAEAAQVVGGDDLHPRRMGQLRGIITGARDHVGALGPGQHGKARRQPRRADLGTATAAQRPFAQRLHQCRNDGPGQRLPRHHRKRREPGDEFAVDPVLDLPQPRTGQA